MFCVCFIHLLPSWKRANSSAVLSSTVSAVTVTGPLALLGKQPCSLTSCQSEWILQMSTESKYLWEETDERMQTPLVSYVVSKEKWFFRDSSNLTRCSPRLICMHHQELFNISIAPEAAAE